jgi:hypothetical protein
LEIIIDCPDNATPEFVPPLAIGNTFVTFVVRSIVPGVMSLLTNKPVESTPVALLCTRPAEVNAGSVIVLAELPIITPPVDVPVFMFVAKLELLLMPATPPDIVVAPVTVAPDCPVSNPAEVIVPDPVV